MAYIGNEPGVGAFIVATELFSGTGSCTQFTLTQTGIQDANAIEVLVSSIQQDPINSYSVANGVITFTEAPPSAANNIIVTYRATTVITYNTIQNSQIPDGTITVNKLASGVLPDAASNSAASYANSAFLRANTPSQTANSAASYANSGFVVANSTTLYANSAFARANNSINANTGGTITGDLTITNNASFYGPIFEKANVVITGGLTSTVTFNVSSSGIILYTGNATADATVNFTGLGSTMAVGNVITYAVMVPNGATAYRINTVQIDGNAITPKWSGGAPLFGSSANTDMYTFSIFKTSATPTYNVFAQVSNFF